MNRFEKRIFRAVSECKPYRDRLVQIQALNGNIEVFFHDTLVFQKNRLFIKAAIDGYSVRFICSIINTCFKAVGVNVSLSFRHNMPRFRYNGVEYTRNSLMLPSYDKES